MRKSRPIFWLFICATCFIGAVCQAGESSFEINCDNTSSYPSLARNEKKPPRPISFKTSAPPKLGSPLEIKPFGCRRHFVYRREAYPLDSFNKKDGERLRPLLENVPEALSLLNRYQRNRKNARVAAYFSTVGVILGVAGYLISREMEGQDRVILRTSSIVGGSVLTLGGLSYGFALLVTNEGNLTDAVDIYNKAYPKDKIKLQFTTGIFF